jgi:hypothetical protein
VHLKFPSKPTGHWQELRVATADFAVPMSGRCYPRSKTPVAGKKSKLQSQQKL